MSVYKNNESQRLILNHHSGASHPFITTLQVALHGIFWSVAAHVPDEQYLSAGHFKVMMCDKKWLSICHKKGVWV